MFFEMEERPPTADAEVSCREALLVAVGKIADEFGLEMQFVTAWENDEPERVQVVFLMTSTAAGLWCIGAIVRRHNGELRVWPRDSSLGPIHGSIAIETKQFESNILEMVEQFTAA